MPAEKQTRFRRFPPSLCAYRLQSTAYAENRSPSYASSIPSGSPRLVSACLS